MPIALKTLLINTIISGAMVLSGNQALAQKVTYKNTKFGTTIQFEEGLFTDTAPLPANGDGILYTHPDGGSLAVFAYNNALNLSPKEMAASVRDLVGDDFSITYERIKGNWMVQSGYEGDLIYYQRMEFEADNIIHGFLMKWPQSLRSKYDNQVGAIGKSLSGRR